MSQAWLKDIKGMWVATYQEGRLLGTVNTVLLDPAAKQITGLGLRSGALLSGEEWWIRHDQIDKVGDDLIFIPARDQADHNQPSGIKFAPLLGRQVSSKDGRVLGQLQDVAVDLNTWTMVALALNNDTVVTLDLMETVIGEDLILVQAGIHTEKKNVSQEKEKAESVFGKAFLKQTSDALKRFWTGERLSPETESTEEDQHTRTGSEQSTRDDA